MYDAVNAGRIEIDRLSSVVAGLSIPRAGDGRIVLAVDVSQGLRPDPACSPERLVPTGPALRARADAADDAHRDGSGGA